MIEMLKMKCKLFVLFCFVSAIKDAEMLYRREDGDAAIYGEGVIPDSDARFLFEYARGSKKRLSSSLKNTKGTKGRKASKGKKNKGGKTEKASWDFALALPSIAAKDLLKAMDVTEPAFNMNSWYIKDFEFHWNVLKGKIETARFVV